MPVQGPTGLLLTLDDLVAEAGQFQGTELERRHPHPVLLVASQPVTWEETTAVEMATKDPGPPPPKMPSLVFTLVPGRYSTNPSRLSLGRSSVCDVVLPFAAVSKVHAYLTQPKEHHWEITDAGSTNGTAVDGEEATPNQPTSLRDGCLVEFGTIKARFMLPVSLCGELRRLAQAKA